MSTFEVMMSAFLEPVTKDAGNSNFQVNDPFSRQYIRVVGDRFAVATKRDEVLTSEQIHKLANQSLIMLNSQSDLQTRQKDLMSFVKRMGEFGQIHDLTHDFASEFRTARNVWLKIQNEREKERKSLINYVMANVLPVVTRATFPAQPQDSIQTNSHPTIQQSHFHLPEEVLHLVANYMSYDIERMRLAIQALGGQEVETRMWTEIVSNMGVSNTRIIFCSSLTDLIELAQEVVSKSFIDICQKLPEGNTFLASISSLPLSEQAVLIDERMRRPDWVLHTLRELHRLNWNSEYSAGIARDLARALILYRQAADQGDAGAQCNLGFCYQNGVGISRDVDRAMVLFQKAADQGFNKAKYYLGVCYLNGIGVPRDAALGVRLYREAYGFVEAHYQLGHCLLNGIGVQRNPIGAVDVLRYPANHGHAEAQYLLGHCYYGGVGVRSNLLIGIYYYKKAAQQGHAEALYTLGSCYYNGTGVLRNVNRALELFRLAASQGHAMAQYNLGHCYQNGVGVPRDAIQAVALYQLAAKQGYAEAQNNLGVCYHNGEGIAKDTERAMTLFRQAAAQGVVDAQNNLLRLQ